MLVISIKQPYEQFNKVENRIKNLALLLVYMRTCTCICDVNACVNGVVYCRCPSLGLDVYLRTDAKLFSCNY